MPKTCARLTEDARSQIYEDKFIGRSHRQIAKRLNRHHSTISRESGRHTGLRGYRPRQAHPFALQRHLNKPNPVKRTTMAQQLIANPIKQDGRPEHVQGRLKLEGLAVVCPGTIYTVIQQDKAAGGQRYKHLRHPSPTRDEPANRRHEVTSWALSLLRTDPPSSIRTPALVTGRPIP